MNINAQDIIFKEIDSLYHRVKAPVHFTANECEKKYGIDLNTYLSALGNLLRSGQVIKTGQSSLGANLFAVPDYTLPTQGKPNPQPSYKTTIKPFDFVTLLETKTTMCNDGQVHPYSDFLNVERGSRPETGIKQYFNTNPVTVTGTTSFGEFVSTNREVITQAENIIGRTTTKAYLLMWWQYARNATF